MLSRKNFALLNIYHSINDGFFDAIPVLLTFVVLAYGLGEKEVGAVVSAGTALSTLAGLGTIAAARHLGPFRILALLMGICAAGFIGAGLGTSFGCIAVCFTVAMAGYTVFHNICFSWLTAMTARERLGRILSDFAAIGDIGRIPFIALAGYVSALSLWGMAGWRAICLFFGVLGIVAACALFVSPDGARPPAQERAQPSLRRSFGLLGEPPVALAIAASALNAFGNEKIFTFLPLLIVAKGFDPSIIGTFAVGFSVGSFLGKLACGRLLDQFGARVVFVAAEALLSVLLVFLVLAESLPMIIGAAFLIGILTKGTVPVMQAVITIPFQKIGEYDEIFSLNSFLRGVITMGTPLLFGWLASLWNVGVVYLLMAVASLCSVVPLLFFDEALQVERSR